ncbi:MAG TPA: acetylxylan esterase [Armatimonadota bacterium]|jgi:cephalosporin-C deacetylase-like acetyl esterase
MRSSTVIVAAICAASAAQGAGPYTLRFNQLEGKPYASIEPDAAGQCGPAHVIFRALGETPEQDRVIREIDTAGGPARFVLPRARGARAIGVSIAAVADGKQQPAREYRTLPPPARLEKFHGDPSWKEPADWQAYWDRAKAELAQTPMNPRITEVKDKATDTGRLYRVELDSIGGVRIVCWYTAPKGVDVLGGHADRSYPAVQTMPGYASAQGPDDRTAKGFITLAVNPRGHGASNEFWNLPANHMEYNIYDPEKYYYRSAYMDCLRAMQFLRSRPEVDGARIGTEGSSQGGAFSLATAALDGHTAACAAYVPFLSDFPTAVRCCTNGGFANLRARFEHPETPEGAKLRKTVSYVDVRFMAARIHCPTIITVAQMDRVCPPPSSFADFNCLGTKDKTLFLDPPADHELTDNMVKAVHAFLEKKLGS